MDEKVNTVYIANGYNSVQELDIENLKFTKVRTHWGFRPFITEKDGFYIDLDGGKQPVKSGDILLFKELDYRDRKALGLNKESDLNYKIISLSEVKELVTKLNKFEDTSEESDTHCEPEGKGW